MLLLKGESIDVTVILDTTDVAEGAVSVTGEVSSPVADPDPSNNSITLTSGAVTAPIDPVEPVEPGTSGELPYTGNDSTGPLLAGGALLAGVGLLLLGTSTLAVRKRRRA
jgi:LPXTG-motif cell wall-anchored protein